MSVIPFSKNACEVNKFIGNNTYEQTLQLLTQRITSQYMVSMEHNRPINVDHVEVNEQIIMAMVNKFDVDHDDIIQRLRVHMNTLLEPRNAS